MSVLIPLEKTNLGFHPSFSRHDRDQAACPCSFINICSINARQCSLPFGAYIIGHCPYNENFQSMRPPTSIHGKYPLNWNFPFWRYSVRFLLFPQGASWEFNVHPATSDDAVLSCPLDNLRNITEGKARHGVGASVVYGHTTCSGIVEFGAGEAHVGHVASEFVWLLWGYQVRAAAIDRLPGLFEVQQGRSETVDVTVA